MRRLGRRAFGPLATAVGALVAWTGNAQEARSWRDALAGGGASVSLRYRYEQVDEGSFDKDAHASTLRTTLSYRTLPFKKLSVFLEAQNVARLGRALFDNRGAGDLANGVNDRPAVVDPSQTRMQQAYLRLDALDTALDVGRREIAFGDHRFVGNVGWRQNHQTFDGLHLVNRSFDQASLSYAFVGRVVQVNGAEKEMTSHFLNGLVKVDPDVSLELFSYLIDYDELADGRLSTQSYGGKISGSPSIAGIPGMAGIAAKDGKHRLHFQLQYAKQLDLGDNPDDVNADYLHLLAGIGLGGRLNLKVGRELLGGSPENGTFQTPLATGHIHNGWADKFLTIPADGLVDWYASADGPIGPVSWTVVYHRYSADAGGGTYGAELDAQALYSASWKQSFGVKLALYREKGFSTDTSKLWLFTEYAF